MKFKKDALLAAVEAQLEAIDEKQKSDYDAEWAKYEVARREWLNGPKHSATS